VSTLRTINRSCIRNSFGRGTPTPAAGGIVPVNISNALDFPSQTRLQDNDFLPMANHPECLALLRVAVKLVFTEIWYTVKRIWAFLLCQDRNRRRPRPRFLRQESLPKELREELESRRLNEVEGEQTRRICRADWFVVAFTLIAVFCGIYRLYTKELPELLSYLRTELSPPSSRN
jgi:hypothetical protein